MMDSGVHIHIVNLVDHELAIPPQAYLFKSKNLNEFKTKKSRYTFRKKTINTHTKCK